MPIQHFENFEYDLQEKCKLQNINTACVLSLRTRPQLKHVADGARSKRGGEESRANLGTPAPRKPVSKHMYERESTRSVENL